MVVPIFSLQHYSQTKKSNAIDLTLQRFPSSEQKMQLSEQGLHPASEDLHFFENTFIFEWEMQRNEVEQRTIDFYYTKMFLTIVTMAVGTKVTQGVLEVTGVDQFWQWHIIGIQMFICLVFFLCLLYLRWQIKFEYHEVNIGKKEVDKCESLVCLNLQRMETRNSSLSTEKLTQLVNFHSEKVLPLKQLSQEINHRRFFWDTFGWSVLVFYLWVNASQNVNEAVKSYTEKNIDSALTSILYATLTTIHFYILTSADARNL